MIKISDLFNASTPEAVSIDTFNDIKTPEGIRDFGVKNKILESRYQYINHMTFYNLIYGIYDGLVYIDANSREHKLFIKDTEVMKIASNYDDVKYYTDMHKDVFNYMVDFKNNYLPSYEFTRYINAFVVDLDCVSPDDMKYICDKISSSGIKPNLIVNTGNGVHLYYVLEEPFNVYGYKRYMNFCHYKIGDVQKDSVYFSRIKKVYNNLKAMWKPTPEVNYKLDALSIVQSYRMCGSKTKNPDLITRGYLVNDVKHNIFDLAESLGVVLLDDEELKWCRWLHDRVEERERNPPAKKAITKQKKVVKKVTIKTLNSLDEFFNAKPTVVEQPKSNNYRDFSKLILDKFIENEAEERLHKQKRTNLSGFTQTKLKLMEAKSGCRGAALHILMSRANMFGLSEEQAQIEVRDLFNHFNAMYPQDMKTEKELESAFKGYTKHYNNATILRKTDIDLNIENVREVERELAKTKKQQNLIGVEEESRKLVEMNGTMSFEKLATLLKYRGFKTSATTLKRNMNVRMMLKPS